MSVTCNIVDVRMSDDEVERKILPLDCQTIGTNLPVLLLEEVQNCLAVEITETDLVIPGADPWSDAVQTPISTPGTGPFLTHLFLTDLFQLVRALCFVLFQ